MNIAAVITACIFLLVSIIALIFLFVVFCFTVGLIYFMTRSIVEAQLKGIDNDEEGEDKE